MRLFQTILIFVSLCLLYATSVLAQETLLPPQKLPGTSVTIQVPEGMNPADNFPGFHDAETLSSIMIIDSDLSEYEAMEHAFRPTQEAEDVWSVQGLHNIEISTIDVDGQAIPIVKGVQYVGGEYVVDKRIVLLKAQRSVMVSYTIFDGMTDAQISRSIKSIRLGQAPNAENILDSLPYSFTPQEPFVHLDIKANVATLDSFEGQMITGMESRVIISPSLNTMEMSDPKAASETLIRDMIGFGYGSYRYFGEMTINGRKAYKAEVETATMLSTHYLIPTDDKNYVRLHSRGKTKNIRPLEPVIEAIAKSIIVKE